MKTFRRDRLEARARPLREKLLDPALFEVFCTEFTREMNRLRIEASTIIDAARAEIGRIDRDLGKLLQAIKAGGPIESIVVDMKRLEGRKKDLHQSLAEAVEPPPLLHPETASFYRDQVAQLHEAAAR